MYLPFPFSTVASLVLSNPRLTPPHCPSQLGSEKSLYKRPVFNVGQWAALRLYEMLTVSFFKFSFAF